MGSFLAELSAIQLSLNTLQQYFETNKITNHNNIIIVSDNQTVVNTLIMNSISKQPIVTLKPTHAHSILEQIHKIKTNINNQNDSKQVCFRYEWVPGHTDSKERKGCEGNKLADQLADKAAKESYSTPMDLYTANQLVVPINKIKVEIKRRITILWRTLRHKAHQKRKNTLINNMEPSSDDNYLSTHIFWAGNTKNWVANDFDLRYRWRSPPINLTERLNRKEEIAIARIRQGYTYTNDFLANKYSNWYQNIQCPHCQEDDSITHRIFYCAHPPIHNARLEAFTQIKTLLNLDIDTTSETMASLYFTTELLINHNAIDLESIPKTDFVNMSVETAKGLADIFCLFLNNSKLINVLSVFQNHCHT
jgi:ribonuclease HI